MEALVREQVGQHKNAIKVSDMLVNRFPHNAPRRALLQATVMRCQAAMTNTDAARETFHDAVDYSHRHRVHMLEAMLVREYIVAVCDAHGSVEAREGVLPLLGRAVAAMSGGRAELTRVLGAGLDAAAAEALL